MEVLGAGEEHSRSDQEIWFHRSEGSQHWGWLRLMSFVERAPLAAVGVVVLLFLPLMWQVPKLRATADIYAALPSDMPSVLALRQLNLDFPAGRFDPYTVVLTAQSGDDSGHFATPWSYADLGVNPLLSETGYESMLALCDMVQRVGDVDSMLGPPMLIHERVDWTKAEQFQTIGAPPETSTLYQKVLQTHVNGSAVLLQVYTSFLPRGPDAADWVLAVRRGLEAWEGAHPGFTATLSGAAALATDTRSTVMDAMPIYLAVCTIGIMAVVLTLAFALVFTLAATFGTAVVVYQTPLLHGVFPWLADYSGLTYEVVPLAVCVAVALGLDYDIFLVSRIVEFRLEGLSDRSSIIMGVASTGGIISGAGAIMALAFFWALLLPQAAAPAVCFAASDIRASGHLRGANSPGPCTDAFRRRLELVAPRDARSFREEPRGVSAKSEPGDK
eukprot:CAMPEP_0115148038 /NCGR_PEP_ID=MMETSP0227-20121206/63647_1 /TAXON_ID=89957 /ORGANISM="Polarella glacialis, Strain CCMP 1383" /LENGTH=443 /DNA_ID=CAMNT_0002558019 /DNA_START=304 /DNA_END=1636 /DNA_ORIENTATION=-